MFSITHLYLNIKKQNITFVIFAYRSDVVLICTQCAAFAHPFSVVPRV